MVEIFTKDNCAPCAGTKKFLTDNGVEFVEHNVEKDSLAFSQLIDMGYNSVPVVRHGDTHFAGLNLQELRKLV